MKNLFFLSVIFLGLLAALPHAEAQSAAELQQKLQAAQAEIETLKAKIAAMQNQVQQAQANHQLPPSRPLEQALGVEHPIVTAYELATYGEADRAAVKNLLKGKVVSVTGAVERFNEGLGRGFKVFLNTNGSTMQVGGDFNAASSVKSTYTAEEGSEMIIDDEKRGPYILAALNENVVISGFFDGVSRRQVSLNNCVLQKQ
jgi:hypothetical protein